MTDVILPEGWGEARFGDVLLSISNGISEKQNQERKGIPVTRIETISSGKVDFQKIGYVENIKRNTIDRYQLKYGDILFSHINSPKHLGKTALFTDSEELYHGTNLLRLICNKKIVFPMIFHYFCQLLRGKGDFIAYAQHAVNQSSLNQKKILQFVFILPPIAEQEEIAQRVDRAIGHVDELKSRLETLLTTLKTFRQSVLNAAVTGKLTENWNVSSKTWNIELLSQIGCLERGKSKHRPRNDIRLFGNKYPFIQTGEVTQANEIVAESTKFYSDFGLQQSKLFSKGTLCITIAANIADTAILGIDACFPDSIVSFTPNLSKCCVKYVKYFIDNNKENLERFAPATAQKNINLKTLNLLEISLPSLAEQEEIVKRVEAYFALADQIEKQVQSALDKVNLLTQSILAKAFRGELTKEWRQKNPELISGENSAEALLKRIKAEKEALEKSSKKTPRSKVKIL